MDTTFDFEKQKNVPVKYDREVYAATIKAIKRIKQIQELRKRSFYFDRMKPSLKIQKMRLMNVVEKGKDMLIAPGVAKKRAQMQAEEIQQSDEERIEEEVPVKKATRKQSSRVTKKRVEAIEEDE